MRMAKNSGLMVRIKVLLEDPKNTRYTMMVFDALYSFSLADIRT